MLMLYRNGELNVVEVAAGSTDDTLQKLESVSLRKFREAPRSTASSALDAASAALSQSGKASFTVHSSFLNSIKTFSTPASYSSSVVSGHARKSSLLPTNILSPSPTLVPKSTLRLHHSPTPLLTSARAQQAAQVLSQISKTRKQPTSKPDTLFEARASSREHNKQTNETRGLAFELLGKLQLARQAKGAVELNEGVAEDGDEQPTHGVFIGRGMGERHSKKFKFLREGKYDHL